jgi:hypothetical protein
VIEMAGDARGIYVSRILELFTRTGKQIDTDKTATFANSAPANTQVNVDIVKPLATKQRYMLTVYNPSTVTDLTVKIFGVCKALGGATRYAYLDTMVVPKSQAITGTTVSAYSKEIEGIFNGKDLRLVVSNDTALGAAEGFSASIRVEESF